MSRSHQSKRRRLLRLGGIGAIGIVGGSAIITKVVGAHSVTQMRAEDKQLRDNENPDWSYLHPKGYNQEFLIKPADMKQIWDFSNIPQILPDGLTAIKNALNEFKFEYQRTLFPIIDLRGKAIIYSLDDAMWAKYHLGVLAGQPTQYSNPLYPRTTTDNGTLPPDDPNSLYQDHSLQALMLRGVHIVVCHQALSSLAKTLSLSGPSVLDELVANIIPGATQSPSGSSLIAIAQHFGFTYAKQ